MGGKFLIIPLAICLVLLSGCTGQSTNTNTASGSGLDIEFFGSEHEYVIGGDSSETIKVTVRNNGDQDIQSVTAVPYLLAWEGFTGAPTTTCVTPLYKPNPELDRLGSPCTMKWTVTTPSVTKQESFQAGVRVKYSYSTTTTATVYALTANKYAGLRERGTDVRSIKSIAHGSGPIQVDVLVDNVLIYGAGNNNLPVTIRFTNVGRGYPVASSGGTDREFVIDSVTVEAPQVSGINANAGQCSNVRMRQGSSGDCVMTLNVGSSYSSQELEVPIKVIAHYTYVAEQTTTIIVNPSLSGSGTGTSRNP